MTRKVLAFQGGAMRCIASIGVYKALYNDGVVDDLIDAYTGDSFGAMLAAFAAAGMHPQKIEDIICTANLKELLFPFAPWFLRKNTLAFYPLSLHRVASFINENIGRFPDNLIFNTWDFQTNKQIIYKTSPLPWLHQHLPGRDDYQVIDLTFNKRTSNNELPFDLGTLITRSMALPGLKADDLRYMDGGVSEHPHLGLIPDDVELIYIEMGFPGLQDHGNGSNVPKGLLARALEAYEAKAFNASKAILKGRDNLTIFNPKVYDVSPIDFSMSEKDRRALVARGYLATVKQLSDL